MWLLDTMTIELKSFFGDKIPEYAILSHTWADDEVLFEDVYQKPVEQWKDKAGGVKVLKFAELAAQREMKYAWVDTCCIDKRSSAELSEAINSMFEWYAKSRICYAYLSDRSKVQPKGEEAPPPDTVPFEESRWFKRGWTELIAPRKVQFLNREWSNIGSRSRWSETISFITGIDKSALKSSWGLPWYYHQSVHTKMAWAQGRETTREEDRAYSLMGLFGVNMPLLYGEGFLAFERLFDEIIKNTRIGIQMLTRRSPDLKWVVDLRHFGSRQPDRAWK
ncbi:heterokaryon incompatibility protein-domain-containing protein [Xylaria grammica]|nr:heterokaryon incompatibility protein-domain-containing protein [Xylaria grammica]